MTLCKILNFINKLQNVSRHLDQQTEKLDYKGAFENTDNAQRQIEKQLFFLSIQVCRLPKSCLVSFRVTYKIQTF